MMIRRVVIVWRAGRLLVAILAASLAVVLQADPPTPAAESGNRGLFVQTTSGPESSVAGECKTFLVRLDKPAVETTHPCDQWFVPPGGEYLLWVESKGQITGSTSPVIVPKVLLPGHGKVAVSLVPAGSIALKGDAHWPSGGTLRVVGAGNGPTGFERRIYDPARAETGFQVPTGVMLPGLFDPEGNAVALSRPTTVKKGERTVIDPRPPAIGGDLLAIIDDSPKHDLRKQVAVLDGALGKRQPDALSVTSSRLIAIWYAVPAGDWQLMIDGRASSNKFPIHTTRGRVVTIRKQLSVRAPKSALQVTIELPGKEQPKLHVAVRRSGATDAIVRAALKPNETHTFADLEPALVEVVLDVDGWRMIQRADLTLGDASTSFKLEPIHVTGTVFVGEHRARATVGFRGDEKWTEFETDADGAYEATLWKPQRYIVRVKLADYEQREPFSETQKIDLDRTLDFHIPEGKLAVHVIDEETKKGISEAKVTVMSRWDLPNEGRGSTAAPVPINGEGIGLLAPSRTGSLQFFVTAAGYLPHDPVDIKVDAGESRTIEIALKPQGEARAITLALAAGVPAVGAEVQAVDPSTGQLRFRGTAGADGRIDVPLSIAGSLLMIRHANAASEIRPWNPPATPERWTLGAPAEPLSLMVETLEGTPPHYGSPIPVTFWVHGVKLRPAELRFLAWSLPTTDNAGVWTGRNLPREPLRVVAGRAPATGQASFDVLATLIPYPWPPSVKIRAVN
jgi:hypothetical protein